MDESFTHWRGSSRDADNENFLVISDTDDDIESSTKENHFVIESTGSSENVSPSLTPKRAALSVVNRASESAIKRRVQMYTSACSNDEDIDSVGSDGQEPYMEEGMDEPSNDDSSDELKFDVPRRNRNATKKNAIEDESGEDISRLKSDNDNSLENITNNFEDEFCPNGNFDGKNVTGVFSHQANNPNSIISSNPVAVDQIESEPEEAMCLAKREIGVGNIDPLVAQKRALLVCKIQQLESQLTKTKLLLNTGNMEVLPDRGEKIRQSIVEQEKEIRRVMAELEATPLVQNVKNADNPNTIKGFQRPKSEWFVFKQEDSFDKTHSPSLDVDDIPMKPSTSPDTKELGKKAQETRERELALTVDRLQDLHGSLVARPTEDQRAEDPKGLKVKLMPHQQHALAWLMWRERQRPAGGVLADDMGLGKTLTMISLIMANKVKDTSGSEGEDSEDEEWSNHKKPLRHRGGTLVVCPASLLAQWENEIKNRCKRGTLSVEIYHGTNRESVPKRLAKNDVVVTTYNILSREFKTKSTVYKIHWKRVILDEAHIVRNHKSQASEAVCDILASKRWAITGTPIQNKEMDLYSILKFLKCSPFDDIRVWRRWVDNKNSAGHQRLATLMKTLMLRRTKQDLQASGDLDSLPEKFIDEINVKLDPEEQLVYEKVLIYSRTLFAQFLAQRAEKDHVADLYAGKYDRPSFLTNPNKNTHFTKAQNKLLSLHADVKTHEILVLLLRLRQICCHPALIHAMLDQKDMNENGIVDEENVDPDFLSRVNNISLNESNLGQMAQEDEIGIDRRVTDDLLTSKNPVFESHRISSKMRAVLDKVKHILEKNEKMIIVSQWATMLDIMASHLSPVKGATYAKFTGSVPIKDRQGIMDSFNDKTSGPRILLLSLTAGGVGLNLVGGNHLLMIDIHWNPQLETQAQDRIYRFGQTKDVFIYKFICKDTIEERIRQLQERKLDIAQNVLSGDRSNAVSKLTLNDLKSLFAL
ncbi:hypothetical protein KM043_001771 [Ampulex compressa]|nr:hypothetical protein KM043_001771 [Ampulex compressa]